MVEAPSMMRKTIRVVVVVAFYAAVLHYMDVLALLWNLVWWFFTADTITVVLTVFLSAALAGPILVLLTPLLYVLAFVAMLPLVVLIALEEMVISFWSDFRGDE